MNVFLLIIWIFLFSCYMYLLTHEPSIPLYSGDSIILNPRNLVLIVGYSSKFPSIFRSTFVETIVILHLMSHVLGWYPTLFFLFRINMILFEVIFEFIESLTIANSTTCTTDPQTMSDVADCAKTYGEIEKALLKFGY